MPRAVVTGGAGFLGAHLCRALLAAGWEVVAIDNLITGRRENLDGCVEQPGFGLVLHDVSMTITVPGSVDAVLHFASPASPRDYLGSPIQTLKVGSLGTHNTLGLAKAKGARYLLASTSEVYGDPQVHPQPEAYWGNVNPFGPRGVYDEAKRFAEAIAMAYHRVHGLDVKIARIFNVYGPFLRPHDGRVVSTFLSQAIDGKPLTVYGDGSQTRSLCYVEDEIRGFLKLLDSDHVGPLNLGSDAELSVLELARMVLDVTGSDSDIVFETAMVDDPARRRPDLTLASDVLGWRPEIDLADGLARTLAWFESQTGA
ncbi:MAG: UDP-glucuronic acid decarboxylase family protein [Acidimicrobiia bacterium]